MLLVEKNVTKFFFNIFFQEKHRGKNIKRSKHSAFVYILLVGEFLEGFIKCVQSVQEQLKFSSVKLA